jgi:long-chain acyl-CoA synthetase
MTPSDLSKGNILEPLLTHGTNCADREALADAKRHYSYGQLVDAIRRRATVLSERGIRSGDRILLIAPNSADQLIAHFAILFVGAISIPIEGGVSEDRLTFIVRDCEPKAICVDDKVSALALKVADDRQLVLSLGEWAERSHQAALSSYRPSTPDDIACLMYTTGSTGFPKAVVLTYGSLGSALDHIVEYIGCSSLDREGVVLPLTHSFGLGHAYCTLLCGGFLWVNEGLRPVGAVFDALTRHQLNAMPATPSMLRLLLGPYRSPFLKQAGGLKRLVINSEPLPPEQAKEILEALPEADIIVYYGLTEASRSTFLRLRKEPACRYRTVGRSAPRVDVRIRGQGGELTPVGVEGEVCLHGPHLAVGYWRRPEEQAATFRDGWMHTGDLGSLDKDGYLTITGRLKDQINVGGLKVSATEVEHTLRQHPLVTDAAAIGIKDPDGLRGEVLAIAVVARNATLSIADIAAFCETRLAAPAQPRRIAMVDSIPRAPTGKILKGDLLRMFEVMDRDHRTA